MNGIDDMMVLLSVIAIAGIPLLFMLTRKRVDQERSRQGINDLANSNSGAMLK